MCYNHNAFYDAKGSEDKNAHWEFKNERKSISHFKILLKSNLCGLHFKNCLSFSEDSERELQLSNILELFIRFQVPLEFLHDDIVPLLLHQLNLFVKMLPVVDISPVGECSV